MVTLYTIVIPLWVLILKLETHQMGSMSSPQGSDPPGGAYYLSLDTPWAAHGSLGIGGPPWQPGVALLLEWSSPEDLYCWSPRTGLRDRPKPLKTTLKHYINPL